MKKNILFLFLFIIGASCSMAQDTIYDSQMDGPYLMPTNHFPHLLVIDCDIPQWKHQKGEFIGQYHTDTSITVYGIAFTAFLKAYHLFPDSMDIKAYLATASTPSDWQNIEFQYIDSILMSPDIYPTTYFSYTHYQRDDPNYTWVDTNDTIVHSVFPCYELYFSTPHKVADTFYVEFSYDNHSFLVPYMVDFQSKYYDMRNISPQNSQTMFYINTRYPYPQIITICHNCWGGVFPILQPDRPYCNPVGGLRVAERGQDYATLCWDNAGDSVYYQLVFGDDVANPIFTYDTCYTRTGLDTGIFYNAHLRRVCHHDCPYHPDSTLYSPWSPGVEFYLGNTNPNDIGIGNLPTVDFSIYPNPTAGQFSLTLPEGMEARVFIGDADGRSVYDQKATGSVMHFDLSALPAGTYTVTVDTPLGLGTKQLSIVK